jgi:ATP-binding protein involved in chromosome partitioning
MRRIRTYAELEGSDRSQLAEQVAAQQERVARRMADVRAVVGVASGKGGVGKSFLAASLSSALAREGRQVGLLDADLNGPTAPSLVGLSRSELAVSERGIRPPVDSSGLRVISADLLLEDGAPLRWQGLQAESFLWQGSLERGVIREFLADVAWGELDVLVVDLPPGSQRLIELAELVPGRTGFLGVTIPTAASRAAVERSLRLALERDFPVLGLVENMSGHTCPECGAPTTMYPGEAGEALSRELDLPLLGRIPFDREAAVRAEIGDMNGLLRTRAGREIGALAKLVLSLLSP